MEDTFLEFLKHTDSQKEISLVIAQNDAELRELKHLLDQNHFTHIVDHPGFLKYIEVPSKIYFLIQGGLSKRIYDFLVQYSTGQIQIFDPATKESKIITPAYQNVSVVFLVTKTDLLQNEDLGFPIREQAGITYQSESKESTI